MQKLTAGLLSLVILLNTATALGKETELPRPKLAIAGPKLPPPVRDEAESRRYDSYNKLLIEVGFPDLSGEIAKTIASPEFDKMEQINRETLEANWHRMQIVTHARELAAELLAKLGPAIGNPNRSETIADFAARLLSMKRLAIPDAFPDEIRQMKNWDQRERAKNEFLTNAIEKNIIRMREQILSDALHTIHGRHKVEMALTGADRAEKLQMLTDIRRLDILIGRYVRAIYFDHEMGLGHWLGEAMAVGLVHTSRLSKDEEGKKFEALFNERAFAHGEYLSDAISDTMTFENQDLKAQKVKIVNGAAIMEMYGTSGSSRASSSAVRPGSFWERLKASKHGLLTPLAVVALAADEETMMWKAIDGKELTLKEKMSLNLANRPVAKQGNSHAGMAVVYRNAESGVAITRGIDQYAFGPTPWGSTRFVTVKSIFSTPGVFASFSMAAMRPKQLLEHLQNEIREKGYQPVIKVVPIRRPDKDGKLVETGETFEWPVRVSEEEQKRILSIKPEDAQRWYDEDLAPRLTKEATRNITGYGMAFRTYGFEKPNKMACACTEMVELVGMRETGVSFRSSRNQIVWVARTADKYRDQIGKYVSVMKSAPALPTEEIISPSAWAWDTKSETKVVPYRLRSAVEAFEEQHGPLRHDMDKELTKTVSKFVDRKITYTDMQIGQALYAPREFIHRAEVTTVPEGKSPGESTFVRRANPMGIANGGSPRMAVHEAPTTPIKVDQHRLEVLANRKSFAQTAKDAGVLYVSPSATMLLAELTPMPKDANVQEAVLNLAAKLMNLKPINPPRDVPHEIKAMTSGREQALKDWVVKVAATQIETQTRQVLSDIAGLIYGEGAIDVASRFPSQPASIALTQNLTELHVTIGAEIRKMYASQESADSRPLGTTLALLLIKRAIDTRDYSLVEKLQTKLQTYNLELADFFMTRITKENFNQLKLDSLKPRVNPTALYVSRVTRPGGGKLPSATEIAQARYSPYAEAQPKLTRSLDGIFGKVARFEQTEFSRTERDYLVRKMIYEYMLPTNREQKSSNWNVDSSDMLKANPDRPKKPTLAPACWNLF